MPLGINPYSVAKETMTEVTLLAILLILPNVFWQYTNGFPVYHHMKELADTQLVNINRLGFLKEQLYFFIGAIPVIAAALYAFLFYEPFKKYRLFLWTLIFTLAIFTYFKAKNYYAIGLYPIYISFGVVFLSKSTYWELGLLRWEDGKNHTLPQDFADMLGWKELAEKVDKVYAQIPDKNSTITISDNYGQAGAINYYSKNKNIGAVSFNADYINWFNLDIKIENVIRVTENEVNNTELEDTAPYFRIFFLADSITNPFAREYKTKILVFQQSKIDVNQFLKEKIDKEKNFD